MQMLLMKDEVMIKKKRNLQQRSDTSDILPSTRCLHSRGFHYLLAYAIVISRRVNERERERGRHAYIDVCVCISSSRREENTFSTGYPCDDVCRHVDSSSRVTIVLVFSFAFILQSI